MIVDGKKIADSLIMDLKQKNTAEKSICFVLLQDNPASRSFIAQKKMVAEMIGIRVEVVEAPCATTDEALAVIHDVVQKGYDGIVVQLPLPSGVDVQAVLDAVPGEMDIDVLSTVAKEAFQNKKIDRMPPVAGAMKEILSYHNIDLSNKKIVILGKGKLVGAPVSAWLDRERIVHDVVTIHTPEEEKLVLIQYADIIISGTGKPGSVTADMIKDGVVLIDAGTSEQAGKLMGDIDPTCAKKASLYTPVPGGVGPVTVACLFQNLFM